MARPGRFTDEKIVKIRDAYEHQRYLADTDPDFTDTVMDTENRLAEEYGVSRSMIRRIVLGLAYADAGGPIDEQRAAADRSSRVDVNATELIVIRPGGEPKRYVYPGGTQIGVKAVVEDLDQYNESGTPIKDRDKAPAEATPASKSSGKKSSTATPAERPRTAASPPQTPRQELAWVNAQMKTPGIPQRRWNKLNERKAELRIECGYDEPDSAASSLGGI